MALLKGDVVSSGSESYAGITYRNEDSRIEMNEKSQIQILDVDGGKRLQVAKGAVYLQVDRQPPGKSMGYLPRSAAAASLRLRGCWRFERHVALLAGNNV